MSTDEFISPHDLSEWLGIPVGTVYQWRYKNYGPSGYKIGRHVRYRRNEVENWFEQQRDELPQSHISFSKKL